MTFEETPLSGAFLIRPVELKDDRGFFARSFCAREFAARGLVEHVRQCNVSYNLKAGTLRGLHFQRRPHAEAKLVRCTRGVIFDVIVDLRSSSPTFGRWHGAELSSESRAMVYVPEGFAHGFQTITDDTEVLYQMSEFYAPEAAAGIRWNDPRLAIRWPSLEPILSARDSAFPFFEGAAFQAG